MRLAVCLIPLALLFSPVAVLQAQQPPEPKVQQPAAGRAAAEPAAGEMASFLLPAPSIEELVERVAPSIVLIKVAGRDGKQKGLGTGFIIRSNGLVATNLHVIGEARPISVELADGRSFDVTEVHASDNALDLALVRIDAQGLPALPLGKSDDLKKGQPIVVVGNPQGLQQSVVAGVISGQREVDNRDMIQLAIPIEPGNSGSPLLDVEGRVRGIVTMKSLVTDNLGFAVPVGALQPLLNKPNPVPMNNWLTIGALDPMRWKPMFGARWQQRAGRIFVDQPGKGFGGRSLCLWEKKVPELPFEIGVTLRLEDESGAAGLVFHSDGDQKHYGFYPSAGKMRLSRFEGATVYSWTVLYNQPSEHYRPGEWNHLKVRVEKDRIECYVNDHLVLASTDRRLTGEKVGLAKFRDTAVEFKRFQVAKQIPPQEIPAQVLDELDDQIAALPKLEHLLPEQIEPLIERRAESVAALQRQATRLEEQAAVLRQIASDVHVQATAKKLGKLLAQEDQQIDLARAALLVARLDDREVAVDQYLHQIDAMAEAVRRRLPEDVSESDRLAALDKYLFEENGYHGSRTDYYHQANSYLNRVLDDREGLPITLSLLYMELGRRLGLKVEGVGLPGHFVVRHVPQVGESQLIDVFDRGTRMSRQDAGRKVLELTGRPLQEEHLAANSPRAIISRILANLLSLAQRKTDKEAMLRYLEAKVAIDPESVSDRGMRAVVRFDTGRRDAGIADLDWFLDHPPEGLDLERIRQMRDYFLHRRR